MSAQGRTVKDIATLMQVGEDYVREVIHAFNERGFDALDPKWSGGRPGPSMTRCASSSG
ncbi:helix-turn-helix domain-containing protein [Streptomyces sp. NPDC055105]|uniref:helix-turn-helix domain-containing protein n=1 Tax=Streptomyces sp. NPDC055105 TaxID=3365719 RepID=UPI0037CE89BB